MTADLQARRRLGLTATLVREDGREGDVFSLIGPKRYDAPWKDIEAQGYIAPADCVEVRVTLPERERMAYAIAEPEERYRLSPTGPAKTRVVEQLVARHAGDQVLVIGQYLDQLDDLAERLDAPVITGETTVTRAAAAVRGVPDRRDLARWSSARWPTSRSTCPRPAWRSRCRARSARGRRRPSASAGSCGPRRDGRTAHFYAVVARDTVDQDFAAHRQRFLAEQGYAYRHRRRRGPDERIRRRRRKSGR